MQTLLNIHGLFCFLSVQPRYGIRAGGGAESVPYPLVSGSPDSPSGDYDPNNTGRGGGGGGRGLCRTF